MIQLEALEIVERPAHRLERHLFPREIAASRSFDAMKDAHRLGDDVGDVHQDVGDVLTRLESVKRCCEVLARRFCQRFGL